MCFVRKPAQAFTKFTQKGALIEANGELQTRSYDDQQGIPQSNQIPSANESAYMNQEPPYEQPPLNGMSEYGYNQ